MRTTARQPTAPTAIQLSAGQSYYLWTGRDAVLLVESGSIRLRESPEWMSETILKTLTPLHEGQHYQMDRGGWTCLYATQSARVLHYASAAPRYFSLAYIGHLLAMPFRRLRTSR